MGGRTARPRSTGSIARRPARSATTTTRSLRSRPCRAGSSASPPAADGKRFAAGSSLDGRGQVDIYAYEFDPANVSEPIKKILAKEGKTRSAEERAEPNKACKRSGQATGEPARCPASAIYAVAVRPDGKAVAAAGSDGLIRLIETEGGSCQGVPTGPPGRYPARTAGVGGDRGQPAASDDRSPSCSPRGATIAELTRPAPGGRARELASTTFSSS